MKGFRRKIFNKSDWEVIPAIADTGRNHDGADRKGYRQRIPGTEDMKEYKDYLFHIGQSCIGTLIGLPACAVIGALVALLA